MTTLLIIIRKREEILLDRKEETYNWAEDKQKNIDATRNMEK